MAVYFFLFISGLAAGSFLNVISLRYCELNSENNPEARSYNLKAIIGGRSRCPHCQKTLKWYELIPLFSFVVQKRRCRNCGEKLSWQYPIVEILAGLIFVFVPFSLNHLLGFSGSSDVFVVLYSIVWIFIFLLFLLLSAIDFRLYIIPDSVNLSLAILGASLIVLNSKPYIPNSNYSLSFLGYYSSLFPQINNVWLNHLSAAFLAMFFFGAVILITKGRGMGWGDFKLGGALGIIFGWPDILAVLALAFIVGALAGVFLLTKGKKKMKDAVPFGPFLVIGAALVFFFGYNILQIYFRIFLL